MRQFKNISQCVADMLLPSLNELGFTKKKDYGLVSTLPLSDEYNGIVTFQLVHHNRDEELSVHVNLHLSYIPLESLFIEISQISKGYISSTTLKPLYLLAGISPSDPIFNTWTPGQTCFTIEPVVSLLASHYATYFDNANTQYIQAALTPADLFDGGQPVVGIDREKYPLLLALMGEKSRAIDFIEAEINRHWDDIDSLYMQRYLNFYLPAALQRTKEM